MRVKRDDYSRSKVTDESRRGPATTDTHAAKIQTQNGSTTAGPDMFMAGVHVCSKWMDGCHGWMGVMYGWVSWMDGCHVWTGVMDGRV